MLYKNRQRFTQLSIKIGILFSKFHLSPNQWTLITIIPAIIAAYFLTHENFLYAGLLFIIAAFIDLIDGSVARVTGKVSIKGAYLDTIIDRYVEAIIIFGLLFVTLPSFYLPATIWLFIYFFGGLMTTYAKAAAKEKELIEKELKGGILERAERLMVLFVGILFAYLDKTYLVYVIVILAVLSNISALQRIEKALKSNKLF